jgi:hypothetical protein
MNRLHNEDDQQFANRVAQKLAVDLDAGDRSFIKRAAGLLLELPNETVRIALKDHLDIARMVKHELDLDDCFNDLLCRISNAWKNKDEQTK